MIGKREGWETVWAIIPVRSFDGAKERLASVLPPEARADFARAMLADVLSGLRGAGNAAGIAVVSPDETVLAEARNAGAFALSEPRGAGLNGGLELARAWAIERGAQALLVLPSDVPQLDPADINSLVDALPARGVVLAEGEDGGTMALLLRPPSGFPFRFGPDSARTHRQAAAEFDLRCEIRRPASLAWDVDRPEDLERLAAEPGAAQSRAVLSRLGIVAGRRR